MPEFNVKARAREASERWTRNGLPSPPLTFYIEAAMRDALEAVEQIVNDNVVMGQREVVIDAIRALREGKDDV